MAKQRNERDFFSRNLFLSLRLTFQSEQIEPVVPVCGSG